MTGGGVTEPEFLPKEILEAMTQTVTLAQLVDGQIAALRHWAKGRAHEAVQQRQPDG